MVLAKRRDGLRAATSDTVHFLAAACALVVAGAFRPGGKRHLVHDRGLEEPKLAAELERRKKALNVSNSTNSTGNSTNSTNSANLSNQKNWTYPDHPPRQLALPPWYKLQQRLKCVVRRWSSPWLMFVGDENWLVFCQLLEEWLTSSGARRVAKFEYNSTYDRYARGWCDPWLFDHDSIWAFNSRHFRISLRFNICPELRVPYLDKPFTARRLCCSAAEGNTSRYDCEGPWMNNATSEFDDARWQKPTSIFFGHGLGGMKHSANASCNNIPITRCEGPRSTLPQVPGLGYPPRYTYLAHWLSELRKKVPMTFWVTNFRVERNYRNITDGMITSDMHCQCKAARKYDVQILDLSRRSYPTNMSRIMVGNCFWPEELQHNLMEDVFRFIGCQ